MFKSINGGRLPERATKYSAGFDVFSNEDVIIGAGETRLISLGITLDEDFFIKRHNQVSSHFFKWAKDRAPSEDEAMKMANENADENINSFKSFHYFALHIRSSLRAKGLTSLGTGVVDIDFRDEIKMIIHNPFTGFDDDANPTGGTGWSIYRIKKGDKIGQLILCRHEGWLLPTEYTKDKERSGGFGSTDKKEKE